MAEIIIASLVLIAVEIAFCIKRPDPRHEYSLGLYQQLSAPTDTEGQPAATSDLARIA